jgi:hypothetical protein
VNPAWTPLSVLVASAVLGCGGEVRGASSASDASASDALQEEAGCTEDDSGTMANDAATYQGAVVASGTTAGRQVLSAGFPYFGGFPSSKGGTTCNCGGGIALPAPSQSAGIVTVQVAHCGALVASLAFSDEGGFAEYDQSPASWTPGAALAVSAAGDPSQVHAFAGTLQTGVPIAGLSPAIGPSGQNIVIPLDQDLVVSWTPEGRSNETVDVVLEETTPSSIVTCTCFGPDAAGTMTVPSALLSQHLVATTTKTVANASVSRTIETLAAADDAVVDLVGVVTVGGPVDLE